MRTMTKLLPLLALPFVLTACPGGDDEGNNEEVGDTGTETATESSTTDATDTVDTVDTVDTQTTTAETTANTTETTDTTTGEDPFVFAEDPPENYTRVDRMGMPAVATALITTKDEYNAANPVDDVAMTFVDDILNSLMTLHGALDDDLTGLGLTTCTTLVCVGQGGPLVIPDTLKINLANPAGFPNGRALPDQVIDVTLAVIFLDLSVMGQTVTTFAEIPVNPAANDVEFSPDFPYLADPH